jgi:hypothetical protein
MRHALFARALALCVLGGVGVASALTDPQPAAPSRGPEFGAAAGSEQVGASVRPNAGPAWTVLRYRTGSGRHCATVGQLVGGKVGRVDALDHRFRPTPMDEIPCDDPGSLPAGYGIDASISGHAEVEGGDVTLVWGTTEPGVDSVTVTRSGDGSQRRLIPSKERAVIAAYAGYPLPDTFTVTAVRADGTEQVYELPPLFPDPGPSQHAEGGDHTH